MSTFNIADFAKNTVSQKILTFIETKNLVANQACVLFDADGVLYDGERLSHYASVDILIEDNLQYASTLNNLREELSDQLVGVKVINQLKLIKQFFEDNDLDDLHYADNFDIRRDNRQNELFNNLKPIDGVVQTLEMLTGLGIKFALVSRSRYEPMILKIKNTGLDTYFNQQNTFNSFKQVTVEKYAKHHGILANTLNYDKTSLFLFAASQMGVSPDKCIGIEDTYKGVKSIINAGMYAICFTGADATNTESLINVFQNSCYEPYFCNTMI